MPSGPKKRRAAKKKKEALAAHVRGVDNTTTTTSTDPPSSATTLLVTPGEATRKTQITPDGNGSERSGELRPSVEWIVGVGEGVMEEKDGTPISEGLGTMVTEKYAENGDGNGRKQTRREEDSSSDSSESSSAEVPTPKDEDLSFDAQVGSGGPVTPVPLSPQATPAASSVVAVEPEEIPMEEEVLLTSADVVEPEKVCVEEEPTLVEGGEASVKAVEYLSVEEVPAFAKREGKDLTVHVAPTEKATEGLEQQPQARSEGVNDEVRGSLTVGTTRRTSWWSCCGLFDAFLSPDR